MKLGMTVGFLLLTGTVWAGEHSFANEMAVSTPNTY